MTLNKIKEISHKLIRMMIDEGEDEHGDELLSSCKCDDFITWAKVKLKTLNGPKWVVSFNIFATSFSDMI